MPDLCALSIPCSQAFGGQSLLGKFTTAISDNLAHFPTGPALTDDFWPAFVFYHMVSVDLR